MIFKIDIMQNIFYWHQYCRFSRCLGNEINLHVSKYVIKSSMVDGNQITQARCDKIISQENREIIHQGILTMYQFNQMVTLKGYKEIGPCQTVRLTQFFVSQAGIYFFLLLFFINRLAQYRYFLKVNLMILFVVAQGAKKELVQGLKPSTQARRRPTYIQILLNRPGVGGAVLQIPLSLINEFIQRSFSPNLQQTFFPKPEELGS